MMGWLDIDDAGSAVRVMLAGPSLASELDDLLATARTATGADRDIEIDCRCVDRLNTGALQILAALAQELAPRGHGLRLVRASAELEQLIDLAGFSGLFHTSHAP